MNTDDHIWMTLHYHTNKSPEKCFYATWARDEDDMMYKFYKSTQLLDREDYFIVERIDTAPL